MGLETDLHFPGREAPKTRSLETALLLRQPLEKPQQWGGPLPQTRLKAVIPTAHPNWPQGGPLGRSWESVAGFGTSVQSRPRSSSVSAQEEDLLLWSMGGALLGAVPMVSTPHDLPPTPTCLVNFHIQPRLPRYPGHCCAASTCFWLGHCPL